MKRRLIENRVLIIAISILVFLFNGHKIAGRFGALPKEEIGSWAKEFPGLIITHQPFETIGVGIATISIYLLITGIYLFLAVKVLSKPKYIKYLPLIVTFIYLWGIHEVHHIFSPYPSGKTFALWFSLGTVVVLPAIFIWNNVIAFLIIRKFSPNTNIWNYSHRLTEMAIGAWGKPGEEGLKSNKEPSNKHRIQTREKSLPAPKLREHMLFRLDSINFKD